jgi:hypothetical protein
MDSIKANMTIEWDNIGGFNSLRESWEWFDANIHCCSFPEFKMAARQLQDALD